MNMVRMHNSHQRYIPINGVMVPFEGQGGKAPVQQDAPRHATYAPPPRKRDMEREIYDAIYRAGRAVTRREIAQALGLVKATWINQHIEHLVTEKYLIRIEEPYRPGFPKYLYEVAR